MKKANIYRLKYRKSLTRVDGCGEAI